jgi:hypothetical protein
MHFLVNPRKPARISGLSTITPPHPAGPQPIGTCASIPLDKFTDDVKKVVD